MQNFALLKTQDGNMTLILDARNFSVGTSHPNYQRILEVIKAKAYDTLESLLDIPKAITTQMGGDVTVKNGQVFYRNMPMHNTITERIFAFLNEGLDTVPLVRFLENMMQNPMPMAIAELYDFLEHRGFPITEDGCFVGYKGINDNWTDKHTGTIDNSIGKVVSMPREQVDPNRRNECSYGLHVGTLAYASVFGSRVILVKVNPKDCIAVPKDHDCSKLRVCQYEVLSESAGLIETPMYPMPSQAPAYVEDDSNQDDDDDDDEDWGDYEDDDVVTDLDDDDDSGDEEVTTTTTTVTMTKRTQCSYCGAKGGKRHADDCKRPRK